VGRRRSPARRPAAGDIAQLDGPTVAIKFGPDRRPKALTVTVAAQGGGDLVHGLRGLDLTDVDGVLSALRRR
jgi:hypothetical protein